MDYFVDFYEHVQWMLKGNNWNYNSLAINVTFFLIYLKKIFNRCFGLLLSPGRNVKHGDMQLIEMVILFFLCLITIMIIKTWEQRLTLVYL